MKNVGLAFATILTCATTVQAEDNIEWPAYGGSPGGGHYSRATEITKVNVNNLVEAWQHRSGDFRAGSNAIFDESGNDDTTSPTAFAVTPLMVENTVYYCTSFNRVFALEPDTGAEKWVFDPEVDMAVEGLTNCRGVSSWVDEQNEDAFCGHRIMLGTLDGRIFAIDGKSGKRCPDFGNNGEISLSLGLTKHEAFEYQITSAPAIIGDLVISGAMVIDSFRPDVPAGVVRAYNIRTGEFVWGWNPTHPDREQADEVGTYTPGTTNVWSTISVDAERGLVIVPTGNSSPDYYGGDREGHLDYYSSSVVALDAATGEVNWNYQTVHHDIWDYDIPAQPTFVDLTIDGRERPAVVQVTKMGMTFVLDRETGQPLHPVEERAVPQEGAVPGEYLSPTQPFPLKPEPLHQLGITPEDAWGLTFIDKNQCKRKLKKIRTGPIYTPPSLEGTAYYPSPLGGNNWGAPAVDLDRKIMIANTHHMAMEVRLAPQNDCPEGVTFPQHGSQYCVIMTPITSALGAPCSPPPWATLAAVDLEAGNILWQIPFGSLKGMVPWPFHNMLNSGWQSGGPMVTKSGLIFIGATMDGFFRAFDIEDGKTLWEYELPTSANTVPMSYTYNGEQYVLVAAGGHFTSPLPAGDYVTAFKLP
ncbi:MAG: PQQ-binding-like beta-propeller repeat protein [Pseudomonadales bacterium]|nr:PQQ-binding-like beta-propeller repeat protein [Pseudomonadales bacterium]